MNLLINQKNKVIKSLSIGITKIRRQRRANRRRRRG